MFGLLTAEEAAKGLHYKSTQTIRRMIKNKEIKAVKIHGKLRISVEEIERIKKEGMK